MNKKYWPKQYWLTVCVAENRTSHLHHHHHLHHLHHPQQHQQQQQKQHQHHHHHSQQQHQQHQQPHHVVPGVPTARTVPLPPILHNRPVPPPTIPPMVSKLNYYSPPPPPPPPPDVTVFSSQNVLSTFAHKPDETEGHLVWVNRFRSTPPAAPPIYWEFPLIWIARDSFHTDIRRKPNPRNTAIPIGFLYYNVGKDDPSPQSLDPKKP